MSNYDSPGSEMNPGLDTASGLPTNPSDSSRDLLGQPFGKTPTALGNYDYPLSKSEDSNENGLAQTDSLTGLQTQNRTVSGHGYEFESGITPIDYTVHLAGKALDAVDQVIESSTPVVKKAVSDAVTQISESVHDSIDTAQKNWNAPDNELRITLNHRFNQAIGFAKQKINNLTTDPDVKEAVTVATRWSHTVAEKTKNFIETAQSTTEGWVDQVFDTSYLDKSLTPASINRDHSDPFIGVIDTSFEPESHGAQVVDAIQRSSHRFPDWIGDGVGTGRWTDSLVQFVDAAKTSGQSGAIANLSFDLTQINPDGSVSTRYELTTEEKNALKYAEANGVLVVVSAGNQNSAMSALGQASQNFDNVIAVGATEGRQRADYSSYGAGLDFVAASQETAGTSLAAARVTGEIARIWDVNPQLNYRQVIQILESTATDLQQPGRDVETGFGQLNTSAAIDFAEDLTPQPQTLSDSEVHTIGRNQTNQDLHHANSQRESLVWQKSTGTTPSERPNWFLDDIVEGAGNAIGEAGEFLGDVANTAVETVDTVVDNTSEFVNDATNTVVESVGNALDTTSDFVSDATNTAVETVDTVVDNTSEFISDATNTVVETVVEPVSDAVGEANEFLGDVANTTVETVDTVVDNTSEFVDDVADTVVETVVEPVDEANEFLGDVANTAVETVDTVVDNTSEFIGDAANTVVETVVEPVGDAVDEASEFLGDVANTAVETVDTVVDSTSEFVGDALDTTGDFISDATNTVSASLSDVGDFVSDVVGGGTASDLVASEVTDSSPQDDPSRTERESFEAYPDVEQSTSWEILGLRPADDPNTDKTTTVESGAGVGLASLGGYEVVYLQGQLLEQIKADPDMMDHERAIIEKIQADPRYGREPFHITDEELVGFGGERWTSPEENWFMPDRSLNPALHLSTWQVAANELTWVLRNATVEYWAEVTPQGEINIEYRLNDRLDLSPTEGRSPEYNAASTVLGSLYHDLAGGNRNLQTRAEWNTTVDANHNGYLSQPDYSGELTPEEIAEVQEALGRDIPPERLQDPDVQRALRDYLEGGDASTENRYTGEPLGPEQFVDAPSNLRPNPGVLSEAQAVYRTRVSHNIGVQQGREYAEQELGYAQTDWWDNPFEYEGPYGRGIDDVMIAPNGNIVIVEYKGGGASLAPGQMEPEWIEHQISRLRTRGYDIYADRLETARQEGRLEGIALHTEVEHYTLEYADPGQTTVIGEWKYEPS